MKVKNFNFGYLADLSFFGIVLVSVLMKTNTINQDKRLLVFLLIAIVVFVLLYMFCQNTKITNKSESKAFIKAENGENVEELWPNSTTYGIDGVKIKGVIYKTPDGTQAIIKENGKLKVNSITGALLYFILGGKKEAKDLPSDWDPLKQA